METEGGRRGDKKVNGLDGKKKIKLDRWEEKGEKKVLITIIKKNYIQVLSLYLLRILII